MTEVNRRLRCDGCGRSYDLWARTKQELFELEHRFWVEHGVSRGSHDSAAIETKPGVSSVTEVTA